MTSRPTDDPIDDRAWLDRAIDLAVHNVEQGGGPFGAVIVHDGALLASGQNRVILDHDPTAHAEVQAIRAACAVRADFALDGCVLYSSCEPCPLCISAALWARLDRIVYAADRDDAARGGFDDRAFYELFARDRDTWPTPVQEIRRDGSFAPFQAWLDKPDRTPY
jgi:guanine deaminase